MLGEDRAAVSLVLGITGLSCVGIPSIAAFIITNPLRQESKRTGQPLHSSVQAGWILSLIGLALLLICVLIFLISLLIAATAPQPAPTLTPV